MLKTRKSKFVACAIAGSLVVGAVGVGAVSNMKSIIAQNHFAAAVDTSVPDPDSSVTLTGTALDHTFDTATPGDYVTATWTVKNKGTTDATLTGGELTNLVEKVSGATATDDHALAENLTIKYTVGDESYDGGTVASPKAIVGNGLDATLKAGASEDFDITVTLAKPFDLIDGHKDGDTLEVSADYSLGWSTAEAGE